MDAIYLEFYSFICRQESQDSSFANCTQQMSNKNNTLLLSSNMKKILKLQLVVHNQKEKPI